MAAERGERAFEAGARRVVGAALTRDPMPDLDAACEHYRAALALTEERAMRPLAVHCQAGLAAVHGLLGDRTRAAEHRATALELAHAIGMAPPAELTRTERSSTSGQ